MASEVEKKYDAFIASIDNSVAGSDMYGNLSWHIECSAESNAIDMGLNPSNPDFYKAAYETAVMCHDAWQDFYPQLIN